MALTATLHRFRITLSDVERAVYESLDLRVARHPSESGRYLWLRTLAFCLSYEEGIGFSKGGLSEAEQPPVAIWDAAGVMRAWIDVGAPSAERVHRASKLSPRVALFTSAEPVQLRREAAAGKIFEAEKIEVYGIEAQLIEELERRLAKQLEFELVHSGGRLYVTLGGVTLEAGLETARLLQ